MTTRFRPEGESSFVTYSKTLDGSYITPPTQTWYGTGLQVTTSEGNPYRLLGESDSLDIGGPFDTTRIKVDLGSECGPRLMRYYTSSGSFRNEYVTMALPNLEVRNILRDIRLQNSQTKANAYMQSWWDNHRPADSTLNAWGTTVISSVKPTNPIVDLSISVGEFVSERKFFALPGTAGSVEGEYLNYMFGVAPTLSDIQDLRHAISDKEELIAQHVRDSGRRVRRRFDGDEDITSSFAVAGSAGAAFLGTFPNTNLQQPGVLTTNTRKSVKYAFSGAFTYYLPKTGWVRKLKELDYLYGVVPGLSLGWELLPFSWLVDYKSSLGDAISNIDSFSQDGLVMPYAYVMCRTETRTEYEWRGNLRNATGAWEKVPLVATVTTVNKRRLPANPFGFGLLPGDLSLRQQSIIAALGLATVRNK